MPRLPTALPWLAGGFALTLAALVSEPVALVEPYLAPFLLLGFARRQEPGPGAAWLFLAFVAAYLPGALLALGPTMPVVLGSVALSLLLTAPLVLDPALGRGSHLLGLFVYPAARAAAEGAAARLETVGTYPFPAKALVVFPDLAQLVSVTGVTGLSFLLALLATTAHAALADRRAGRITRAARTVAAFGLGLACVCFYGDAVLARGVPLGGGTLAVATIAGEQAEAGEHWRFLVTGLPKEGAAGRAAAQRRFEATAAKIVGRAEAFVSGKPGTLVVLPEASVFTLAEAEAEAMARLAAVARRTGTYLVSGVVVVGTPGDGPFVENRSVLFGPTGDLLWSYAKSHPVPGYEASLVRPGGGVLADVVTPFGRLAGGVCRDYLFPEMVRAAKARGATLLVAPSMWSADLGMEARSTLLRSLESGLALVVASHGSGVVTDAGGRVVAAKAYAPGEPGLYVSTLPAATRGTPFAALGDWFPLLCALLLAAAAARRVTRSARGGRSETQETARRQAS